MTSTEEIGDIFEIADFRSYVGDELICKMCRKKYRNPRVLSCLHAICQSCLDKRLLDESAKDKIADGILCPECLQETKILICNDCAQSETPLHLSCQQWTKALPGQMRQLENHLLTAEVKSTQFHAQLDSVKEALNEIHKQHDCAKRLILDKYEKLIIDLEKRKEESVQELSRLQTKGEMKLTDTLLNLEKTSGEIDDLCKFTSHLLKHASTVELVSLKDVLSSQLLNIATCTTESAVDLRAAFENTVDAFENAVKAAFCPLPVSTTGNSSNHRTLQYSKIHSEDIIVEADSTSAPVVDFATGTQLPGLLSRSLSPQNPQNLTKSTKYRRMKIALKCGGTGSGEGEFNSPRDFCLGWEEDMVVADTENHRVQFGRIGTADGYFFFPTNIACFQGSGDLFVGDGGGLVTRIQIFTKDGNFVRSFVVSIETLAGLSLTTSGNIVALDRTNPSIYVISQTGTVFCRVDCVGFVAEPSGISYWANEFFVCDFKGNAVVVFGTDGTFRRRIERPQIIRWRPTGIDVSGVTGTVLVGDSDGNRFHVVAFNLQGQELFAFESLTKVFRCYGLKTTSNNSCILTLSRTENYLLAAG